MIFPPDDGGTIETPAGPLALRPATAQHFLPLRAIIAEAVAPAATPRSPAPESLFARSFSPGHDHILLREGNICGIFGVRKFPSHWFLMHLALDAGARGKGIGSALLQCLTRSARDAGICVELTVQTESRARKLYHACGFRPVIVTDSGTRMRYSSRIGTV